MQPSSKPFGIGVIGATGFIGTPYRAEIRACGDRAKIVSLCARRRDRLEKAAEEDGASHITDDWREVVEHPDVDLVLVLTPDALHREPVLACAEAGKHLVCEKPVGVNVEEAAEAWRAYQGSRLAHFVPLWTRYFAPFARARELVQEGVLGEIRAIVYRWQNPRPEAIPFTWRDDATLSAAGSIADVGSHAYDAVRWITGLEARRVLTHAATVSPPKPDLGAIDLGEAISWGEEHAKSDSPELKRGTTYDYGSIAVELENDVTGVFVLSHASHLRKGLCPELELHGTKASLGIDRIRSRLTIAKPGVDGEHLEDLPDPAADGKLWNRFENYVFPALEAQLSEDGAAVDLATQTDHPTLHTGWRVQIFTDAAAASAERGAWVSLSEIDPDV